MNLQQRKLPSLIVALLLLLFGLVIPGQLYSVKAQQHIEPDSQVFIDSVHHTPGSILYVSIFDPNFNRDKDVRDKIDLTQIVEGKPIVEVKILQPTKGTLTLSAVDGSMKDSNGNTVREAVESGPDTSLFEFAVKLPDDMETNSPVTVLYHDPFAITTSQPERASSSSNGVIADLYTDKAEVSLGQDLTIFLDDPDSNLDSRTVESIPLNKILLSTDKFDETPLDIVLEKTGIRTDHFSLRETGPNTGIFEVMLENINSKLVDRDSEIRIVFLDQTPSGGGPPIRVETVVPVVPAKIGIAFNKKQYSPFEDVKIALMAQMFNIDRNKVDIVKDRVVMSTSSGQTYHPTMIETGVDTGIFVGRVQLTSNQTEKLGDLLVKGGDILRVTAGIIPGYEVSDSATIFEASPPIAKDVKTPNVTIQVQPPNVMIPKEKEESKKHKLMNVILNDQNERHVAKVMIFQKGTQSSILAVVKGTGIVQHISMWLVAGVNEDTSLPSWMKMDDMYAVKIGETEAARPMNILHQNLAFFPANGDSFVINADDCSSGYCKPTMNQLAVGVVGPSVPKVTPEGSHKNTEKTSAEGSHKNKETIRTGIYFDSHTYSFGQYAGVLIVDKNLVKNYDGIDSYRPKGLVTLQINDHTVPDSFLSKVFITSFRETGPHTGIFKALLRVPSTDDLGQNIKGEELRVNYFDAQNDEVWHDTATVL